MELIFRNSRYPIRNFYCFLCCIIKNEVCLTNCYDGGGAQNDTHFGFKYERNSKLISQLKLS